MEKNNKDKLTSVIVDKEEFKKFKINSIVSGITFKYLVNKTMYLFNNDEVFVKLYFNTTGSIGE